LTAGSHPITAVFTTTGGFGNSTSSALSQMVNKAALTITAVTNTKTYDGTIGASAIPTVAGLQGSDTVTGLVETYDTQSAGTGKTLVVTAYTINDGNGGNNYTVTTQTNTTGQITPRAITVTAATDTKTYDATTSAAATPTITAGALQGTDTADFIETYDNKNAGTGKTLAPSGIVNDGNSGHNYTYTFITNTTGVINQAPLTITAVANTKTYDAATSAAATPTVSGLLGSDTVTGLSETYDTKNVGTGKTLTPAASVSDGNSGNNYAVSFVNNTTGGITAQAITVTATTNTKTYDGTVGSSAVPMITLGALQGTDTANFIETYDTKNAVTGKTLTPSGSVNDGNGGNNYTVTTVANTTGVINKASLTITATGLNKVYEGTTTAMVTLSDNHVSGDVLTDSYTSASFADKNVGTNKTISVSGISISGADAGNYVLQNTTASTTASITARSLTVTATADNKTYDGTTTATVALSDNRVSGDNVTDSYTSASSVDKNVGTGKAISVSGIGISGTDAGNYSLQNTTASTTADITARALTITATADNKTYDGTTTATVALSDNRIAGDNVVDSDTSASFADKIVGTGKAVSVSGIAISGADAGNYALQTTTATTSADIAPAPLMVTATGLSKVYDGTTGATITLSDNHLGNDQVTDSYASASFADQNVGTGTAVSVTGIAISGADAGNYALQSSTASTTAAITVRALHVAATGQDKVYDGTIAATVNLADDRISGDVFTDSYAGASFADKNVGTGKAVSVSGIAISGTDAGNYSFNTRASTTANITPRTLTITAAGVSKTYDGTDNAMVTLSDDRVPGDSFTESYATAVFDNQSVGAAKPVSVSGISISGTDASNYTLAATTASTTAAISQRDLTVTATADGKVYDGTTAATVHLSDNKVQGDDVTDIHTGAVFASKNVGTPTVTASGISLSGADAANYHLVNTTATTAATISPRALTVTTTAANKTYDGTTTATVTLSDNRVAGDNLTDSYTGAGFADKNMGTGKTVNVGGIEISGTDAGNYSLQNTTTSTTADITQRELTVIATGLDKVYDGTTTATVTLTTGALSGDDVTANASASFADRNAGTGVTVSVSGIGISGTDASNYSLQNTTASATASITARALTITATGVNKVYDGTTTATVTLSDNRISGDVFTDSHTAAGFADKNVGTGKAISVGGISISGADASNYTLQNTTASTMADITPRALTVSATADNKTYDGTTTATAHLADDRVSGDVLTDSYATANFADKDVGTGQTVTINGIGIGGADAGNYTVNPSTTTTANITPRPLTVIATANKVYDGTTAATVTFTDDRVAGDVFTVSDASASFPDQNAGTGQTVTISGIAISGADAGNYALQTTTAVTTANIAPAPLTITATTNTKPYDGTTSAAAIPSVSGLHGSDTVTGLSETYESQNAGTGQTLSVASYMINDGNGGGNYTVITVDDTTGVINKATLTITAKSMSKLYGALLPALTASFNGFVDGDTSSLISGLPTLSTTATSSSPVGNYAIAVDVSGMSAVNYTFAGQSGTLTINPAPLAVTADNETMIYGETLPALTYNVRGLVNGDTTRSVLSGSLATTGSSSSHVGTYEITQGTLASDANYTIGFTGAMLSITPAPLTITANHVTKVYGAALPTLTASFSGFVNGDTPASLTTPPTLSTTATAASHVQDGGYIVTASGAVDPNYAITYVPGTLTITPAPLTISADPQSMVLGAPLPALTASFRGFVNGDTPASLSTPASLMTSAAPTSPAGSYPIWVSGASSTDYTIMFHTGTLTIVAASPLPPSTPSGSGSVVDQPTSLIVSSTSGGSSVAGQSVSFTVQVVPGDPGAGIPTGQVSLLVDGAALSVATIDPSTGQATLTTAAIGPGRHMITAVYAGVPGFAPSSSPGIQQVVVSANAQVVLIPTAVRNRHRRITRVLLTAQVQAEAPGNGVPTGTISYFMAVRRRAPKWHWVNGHKRTTGPRSRNRLLATRSLSNGTSVMMLKPKQALRKTFTVTYNGDPNFNPSTSPKLVVTKQTLKAWARPASAFFTSGRGPGH
jgi:hypothetical protein